MVHILSLRGKLRKIGLGATTVICLITILVLTTFGKEGNGNELSDKVISDTKFSNHTEAMSDIIESPFKNTLAYVRWNSKHEERLPLIRQGYKPFFHTMHYSIPELFGEGNVDFVNLTHDTWKDIYWGYTAVKNTMKVMLNETKEDEVTGILVFHFDVWIDPLGFTGMNRDKIWILDSTDPIYMCMKNTTHYSSWWGWGLGFHEKALQATRSAANLHRKYKVDPEEWCVGWSDIYYIPRRFFTDFIELSDIFLSVPVFDEVAIPTILHIIDKTYSHRSGQSIISKIGDCWGNCCTSDPAAEDIIRHRCGHRMDLRNRKVSDIHFDRLRQHSWTLGTH